MSGQATALESDSGQRLEIDTEYLQDQLAALLDIPSPYGFTDTIVRYVCGELDRLGIDYDLTRRGAIRAGALLTVPEMQNLVDKLFATDVPLSCPHGRPTLIQFSTEELERRFGRR